MTVDGLEMAENEGRCTLAAIESGVALEQGGSVSGVALEDRWGTIIQLIHKEHPLEHRNLIHRFLPHHLPNAWQCPLGHQRLSLFIEEAFELDRRQNDYSIEAQTIQPVDGPRQRSAAEHSDDNQRRHYTSSQAARRCCLSQKPLYGERYEQQVTKKVKQ